MVEILEFLRFGTGLVGALLGLSCIVASIDMRAAVFNKGGGWYVHSDELVKLLLNNTGGRCMWDADAMEHSCQPHLLSCFLHSLPHRHIQRPRSTARNVYSVSERPASECGSSAVACHLTSPPSGAQHYGSGTGRGHRMDHRRRRPPNVLRYVVK